MSSQSPVKIAHSIVSAPIVFNDASLIAGFRPEDLKIDYVPVTDFSRQPRYAGRVLLKPDVDLDLYQFKAVVDHVEFSLCLSASHSNQQPVNIHGDLMTCASAKDAGTSISVSGPRPRKPYSGKHFVVTVYDPEPKALRRLLHEIRDVLDLDLRDGEPFRIVGIEISLDAYVKDDDLIEDSAMDYHRWRMTNLLRRHTRFEREFLKEHRDRARCHPWIDAAGREQTRYIWGSGRAKRRYKRLAGDELTAKMLDASNYARILTDATYYIGAIESPAFFRSMDKITDQRRNDEDGRIELTRNERRARLEVKVQIPSHLIEEGEGLEHIEMETPDDLFGFRFEKWKIAFFTFWLPTLAVENGEVHPGECKVFERSGVAGLEHYQGLWREVAAGCKPERGVSRRLREKDWMMKYTELNERARRAIRTLSEGWSSAI